MPDFRQHYKENPFGNRNTNEGRLIRAGKHEESRKKQREKTFYENRKISGSNTATPERKETRVKEDRITRMMKWKAEREKRKATENVKKKPPFKVGIVHHRLYSPINKDAVSTPVQTQQKVHNQSNQSSISSNSSKRITKATEKRLMAKAAAAAPPPPKKATVKGSVKNVGINKQLKPPNRVASFAPVDHKFKPPTGMTEMPLFGRVALNNKIEIKSFMFSPMNKSILNSRRSISQWNEESIAKNNDTSTNDDKDKARINNTTDSSIETITLRLSSDEHETLNSSAEKIEQKNKSDAAILNMSSEKHKGMNCSSEKIEVENKSLSTRLSMSSGKEENLNSTYDKIEMQNTSKTGRSSLPPGEMKSLNSSSEKLEVETKSKNRKLRSSSGVRDSLNSTYEKIEIQNTSNTRKSSLSPDEMGSLHLSNLRVEVENKSQSRRLRSSSGRQGSLNSTYDKLELENTSKTGSSSLSSDEKESLNASNDKIEVKNNSVLNSSYNACGYATPPGNPNSPNEPVFFSPYVVSSRGKNNARKEQQLRRGIGLSPTTDIPTKETVMQNLNISIEDEERTAQYFRFILNREIERLNVVCDKWIQIQRDPVITEDAQYQINQAVGQTNLLINKKFERFRSLVADCETGKGEMLVTCKDLQGFWDMMYMEVKDCDSRFERLEKLQSQGWVEDLPIAIKCVPKKKVTVKKKVVPAKKSSIRSLILSERKKRMEEMSKASNKLNDSKNMSKQVDGSKTPSPNIKNNRRSKSFTPKQVKSTPAKNASSRLSLLQMVQLSETNKTMRSPLAIMKISKMCKTPEIQLDETISYVNSDQTPGKSILKRTKDSCDSESRTRSTHKVNFDDNVILNEVPMEEGMQVKYDLGAALARIDNYDLDSIRNQEPMNIERKLLFDDDSDDEHDNPSKPTKQQHYSQGKQISFLSTDSLGTPVVAVQPATPLRESVHNNSLRRSTPKRSSRRQSSVHNNIHSPMEVSHINASTTSFSEDSKNTNLNRTKKSLQRQASMSIHEESDENDGNVRVLRTRVVDPRATPTVKRRSKVSLNTEGSEFKENKTPGKTRRKSALKSTVQKEDYFKMGLEEAVDKISLEENDARRRSRRSVKFIAKDCSGCAENKPALPATPYVRRSKGQRMDNKRRSAFSEDLISWETPEKLPERVRKSQYKKT